MPSTAAITFLRSRITRAPSVVLVLGSGLGGVTEAIQDRIAIPYSEIPDFPRASVHGHAGALVVGILEGVEVAVMQGRFHLYEGWPAALLAHPLRVLSALGATCFVVTNAAGGIRPELRPGDLMLIADHLNFTFRNPLMGPGAANDPRIVDISDPYDSEFRRIALECAAESGIGLQPGVYAAMTGPSYETPSEVRMLARLGADAVGMSTVPEVLAARALGMRTLGISCITNRAATLNGGKLTHEEVLKAGARSSGRLTVLLHSLLPKIAASNLPTEAAS